MKFVSGTFCLAAAVVVVGSVAAADKRVEVVPDSLTFNDGKNKAEITGMDCKKDKPGSGSGKYEKETVDYKCLRTGTYQGNTYAIACGGRNGVRTDVVCQAFYKKQVTNLISCSDIAAGECKDPKDCEYDCKYDKICDVFPGIQYFLEKNFKEKNLVQNPAGDLKITTKKLIAGRSMASNWQQMRGDDLCWFADAISNKCLGTKSVVNNKSLEKCVDGKFKTYYKLGWVTNNDKNTILRTVRQGNLYSLAYLRQQRVKEKKAKIEALKAKKKLEMQRKRTQAKNKEVKKNHKIFKKQEKKQKIKEAKKYARKTGNYTELWKLVGAPENNDDNNDDNNDNNNNNDATNGNATTTTKFGNATESSATMEPDDEHKGKGDKRYLRVSELLKIFKDQRQ